jgi:RecA-family ATPase
MPRISNDPEPVTRGDFDLPPQILKARRFLLYRLVAHEKPDRKPKKVPFYTNGKPRFGSLDSPEDIERLDTFDNALAAFNRGGYAGLGFALGKDGEGYWQGIDLDNLSEHPELEAVREDLPGYTEASPSGNGWHAIGYGRRFNSLGSNASGIEAYCEGRYFTVTGDEPGLGEPVDLKQFVEQRLAPLHGRKDPAEGIGEQQQLSDEQVKDVRSALNYLSTTADGYADWIAFGIALKLYGDAGLDLWLTWSQDSDKYDRREALRAWKSMKPDADGAGVEAIFRKAQDAGWVNPRKGVREAEVVSIWDNPADIRRMVFHTPTPYRWLFKNRFALGRGIILNALGGSGKTRLLYQLAVGAILGRLSWDWEIETTGRALLVVTEDTEEDTHHILHAVAGGLGLSAEERERLATHLTIYPLAGVGVTLLARDPETRTLVRTPNYYQLIEKIHSLGQMAFVGIDPALAVTEGDELSQTDQRKLGDGIDGIAIETGATTCMTAHSPKNNLNTEELSSHGSRGAGAVTDSLRAEYGMRNMTMAEAARAGIVDKEERSRYVQLVATKSNHLPPEAYVPIWLQRGSFGVLSQTDIDFTAGGDSKGPSKRELEAAEVLRKLGDAKLADWRRACVKEKVITAGTESGQVSAIKRIRTKLLEHGEIEQHGEIYRYVGSF